MFEDALSARLLKDSSGLRFLLDLTLNYDEAVYLIRSGLKES